MKKLALIVLLAVVASRVFADRGDHRHRNNRPEWDGMITRAAEQAPPRPEPPAPPGARFAKGRKRPPAVKVAPEATSPTPQVAPTWFPKNESEEEALAQADPAGRRVLVGLISTSTERARAALRIQVAREVSHWLAADVPTTWSPPPRLIDRMILGTYVRPVAWSLNPEGDEAPTGADPMANLDEFRTLYRAGQQLDFSEDRRAAFVESYRRDVASTRMRRSGAGIAVVLAALAAMSLYVRADVATRGYYTNRLRFLATLGLGAAGAAAYRYLA